MKIDIITLFPEMFKGPLTESMISRAQKRDLVKIKIHQLRDWAINSRGQVDDKPYGGGAGMLMRIDVAFKALESLKNQKSKIKNKKLGTPSAPFIILPTPTGKKFDQVMAKKLAKKKHLVFLCPHYEGYDKRIESLVDEKISLGDFVLTGGELPVAVMVDAVVRLLPGVINADSLKEESFSKDGFIEYPQYTRPEVFEATIRGKKVKKRVPKILLSGNHALIRKWREKY